jgi:hypothetical protein
VKLLKPVTISLLLSTLLFAPTARCAAADQLRQERTRATQQAQTNELYQRQQLENLNRDQELNQKTGCKFAREPTLLSLALVEVQNKRVVPF